MKRKLYERELERLQTELVKLQAWVQHQGLRVCVIFEGRDAAGKGGVIRRISERVSPRVFRSVALPKPTNRERGQWYFQRYVPHLPAAGEVVLFDRSWYNRAGVEPVMGFCSEQEHRDFLRACPEFERTLVESGMTLLKYWLTVGERKQEERFRERIEDPRKHWKLSPIDLEARRRWFAFSLARDSMLDATDSEFAPWWIVRADSQREARINCIAHLLGSFRYEDLPREQAQLPARDLTDAYDDEATLAGRRFVPTVVAHGAGG